MKKIALCTGVICGWLALINHANANTIVQNGGNDRPSRVMSELWADSTIAREIVDDLNNFAYMDAYRHRIGVNVFRKNVLLTGEVPNQQVSDSIIQMVERFSGVNRIYNAMLISALPRGQSHTVHESYLKTKLEAKLLKSGELSLLAYELVVRNDTAYFLGQFTKEQAKALKDVALSTVGILSVEILDVIEYDKTKPAVAKTSLPNQLATYPNATNVASYGHPMTNQPTIPNHTLSAYTSNQGIYSTNHPYPANGYPTSSYPANSYPTSSYPANSYPVYNYPVVINPQSDYVKHYQNQRFAP